MLYLIFSIISSVSVSAMLKLAQRYSVNITQMIAWNYPMAILLTYFFLNAELSLTSLSTSAGLPYWLLGFLLPLLFLLISASLRYAGLVKTELAQRISLVVPLLAAFIYFREEVLFTRILAIVLGFFSILLSIHGKSGSSGRAGGWIYLSVVFLGMGSIDILFKYLSQLKQLNQGSTLLLVFSIACMVSFAFILMQMLRKKMNFSVSGMFWGLGMGFFNFINIHFYMRAHQALPNQPSLIFSLMNIGVILLGTVAGVLLFREKLTMLNRLGLLLAVISVILISFL